jgi:hypothetical protein
MRGDGVMATQLSILIDDDGSIPISPLQKKDYTIKPISYQLAMEIVIREHYLHRTAPVSMAFGLFYKDFILPSGVATYGIPPSSTLLRGICGDDEKENVYELNRLWVDDKIGTNAESFLISKSMKFLDKQIIISFADTSQKHVGVIYQACNFLYTGLSSKFMDPKVVGLEDQHHATYAHGLTNQEVREKYGEENVYFVERPRKHRYVYFNAPQKQRQKLLAKLNYEILPYPKEAQ